MTQNVEAEKQRYARELAAYTLQQWTLAKEREKERNKSDKPQSKRSPRSDPPLDDDRPSDDASTVAATKAVDFAMRTAPQQNSNT